MLLRPADLHDEVEEGLAIVVLESFGVCNMYFIRQGLNFLFTSFFEHRECQKG